MLVVILHASTIAGFGIQGATWPAYGFRHAIGAVGARAMEFFFLASGFLVCGILLRLERLRRPWLEYLRNRTKRIVPPFAAYLLILLLLQFLGVVFVIPISSVPGGLWWVVSFATNWLVITEQSWGIGRLIVHFWSLALEEQLYVVAPLIFVALRRYPKVAGGFVLSGVIVVPIAAILNGVMRGPDPFVFLNPFMQLDIFALGMWLATLQAPPTFRRLNLITWAALCAPLLASTVLSFTNDGSTAVYIASLISAKLCGALWFVLVCRAVSMGAQNAQDFVRRFFQLLGRRIYGVYVWHKLVLVALVWGLSLVSPHSTELLKQSFIAFGLFSLSGLLLTLGLCQIAWVGIRPLLYPKAP